MATRTSVEPPGWPARAMHALRGYARRSLGRGVPIGAVRWGDFGRTRPVGQGWGHARGTPVDRYYIEQFLAACARDIRGRVLEIQNDAYTIRFGGGAVTQRDVLDIDETNTKATIIADLNDARELPAGAFDCIVFTQTLQLVFDFAACLRSLERSLAPGGVLLMTVPGITRVLAQYHWYWSFTPESLERLLAGAFAGAEIDVSSFGNVKSATAFLNGLAQEELGKRDLDHNDPVYPVIIAARVRKA